MTHVCFSPVPELALFFGMTSAETGEVQVGFRRRGERGVVLLFCPMAISLQTLQVLLNCAPSTPIHGVHLGLRTFCGCIERLHCRGSPAQFPTGLLVSRQPIIQRLEMMCFLFV